MAKGLPLEEFTARLIAMKDEAVNQLADIAAEMALNAKALAQLNIEKKGIGFRYSENGVPPFFMFNKVLNARGLLFLKAKQKAKQLVTWGDLREAQGLQAVFVDLAYSNDMWRGIGVIGYRQAPSGKTVVAILGGTRQTVQNKMNWNQLRYGNFIENSLTDKDKKALADIGNKRISEMMRKYFQT